MKIISIRWKRGSSDFVHIIVNDDVSRARYNELRCTDTEGLFDIAEFSADTYADALQYVKAETATAERERDRRMEVI